MNWLIDNWYIIFAMLLLIASGIFYFVKFLRLPSEEQKSKIKTWLLWAVTQAEWDLGSGTGRLKLSFVFGLFVEKFPWIAKFLPFAVFSSLVNEVLEEMREILKNNKSAAVIVGEK